MSTDYAHVFPYRKAGFHGLDEEKTELQKVKYDHQQIKIRDRAIPDDEFPDCRSGCLAVLACAGITLNTLRFAMWMAPGLLSGKAYHKLLSRSFSIRSVSSGLLASSIILSATL